MNRVKNLFDLPKTRLAYIDDGHRSLQVSYDLNSTHLFQDQRVVVSKMRVFAFNNFPGSLEMTVDKNHLDLKVQLEDSNRELLFLIFYIITYLLGDNILLSYHVKDFPFAVPRGYNIGGYTWDFVHRKKLILEPVKYIELGLVLLNEQKSIFSQLLIPMLQINNVNLCNVRFFGEFVLLESLSRKGRKQTNIIEKKVESVNYAKLEAILGSAVREVRAYPSFSRVQKKQLESKLKTGVLNNKSSTKDNILSFIDELGSDFEDYKVYVNTWNKLRSSKIAHGFNGDWSQDEMVVADELHRFLCSILYKEFRGGIALGVW